jgi:hypothetical protein
MTMTPAEFIERAGALSGDLTDRARRNAKIAAELAVDGVLARDETPTIQDSPLD